MARYSRSIAICILSLLTLASCKDKASTGTDFNGIYYWRTTFSPNDYEKEFLKKHDVQRLYIKFFDVGIDWDTKTDEFIAPVATIQFNDSIMPGVEVVPTIYITTSAIEEMQLKEEEYAEKIVKRVNAMCRRNSIEYKELQLDCDWTKHTQNYFYKLCEEIKPLLDSTQKLSSTIRLHQLAQTPPPVDKGVLMVYNTGNLKQLSTENSIFSLKDIEPYLRDNRLADYQLPLDVAYPAYGWSLVFRPIWGKDTHQFSRIIRRTDFSPYTQLNKTGKNIYEVSETTNLADEEGGWDWVDEGDIIKVERPNAKEILEVKKLIDRQLAGKPHSNILYHLDESQLSHYSSNDINKIYSRN